MRAAVLAISAGMMPAAGLPAAAQETDREKVYSDFNVLCMRYAGAGKGRLVSGKSGRDPKVLFMGSAHANP